MLRLNDKSFIEWSEGFPSCLNQKIHEMYSHPWTWILSFPFASRQWVNWWFMCLSHPTVALPIKQFSLLFACRSFQKFKTNESKFNLFMFGSKLIPTKFVVSTRKKEEILTLSWFVASVFRVSSCCLTGIYLILWVEIPKRKKKNI